MQIRFHIRERPGTALLATALLWSSSTFGNPALDKRAVEEVIKGIIAADNAGRIEEVISHYAPDAVLISPSGPDILGRSRIREHYAGLFEQNTLAISNEILDTVVSRDWAISRGVNRVTATSKLDGTKATAISKYLMTLRRGPDGDWKIVHLMWANLPEASGTQD